MMMMQQSQEKPKPKMMNALDREAQEVSALVTGPISCSMEDLADRTKAFDLFRRSYRKHEAMEENKMVYKEKCAHGKELGVKAAEMRSQI